MRTKKLFYSAFTVLLAVILCLSVAGCGEKEETKTTQVPSTEQSSDLTSQEQTEDIQYTQDATPTDIPEQEMCVSCGKAPRVSFSFYCVSCKCMICNQRRKFGNYMYCSQHNCHEYGCAAMAVDNSQYCVSHKCAYPGCHNKIWPGSQYCGTHKQ